MINREYYHCKFINGLLPLYVEKLLDLFKKYVTTIGSKSIEKYLEDFRELLQKKEEYVRLNTKSAFDSLGFNTTAILKILTSMNINYKKMSCYEENVKAVTDLDLFCAIYLGISKCVEKHAILTYKTESIFENERNKICLESIIWKSAHRAIDMAFELIFIKDDKVNIYENIKVFHDGVEIPIQTDKLIELFELSEILTSPQTIPIVPIVPTVNPVIQQSIPVTQSFDPVPEAQTDAPEVVEPVAVRLKDVVNGKVVMIQ